MCLGRSPAGIRGAGGEMVTSTSASTAIPSFIPTGCKPHVLQYEHLAFCVCVPCLFWDDLGWRRQGLEKLGLSEVGLGSIIIIQPGWRAPTGTSYPAFWWHRHTRWPTAGNVYSWTDYFFPLNHFSGRSAPWCVSPAATRMPVTAPRMEQEHTAGDGDMALKEFSGGSVSPDIHLHLWYWQEIPPTRQWWEDFMENQCFRQNWYN